MGAEIAVLIIVSVSGMWLRGQASLSRQSFGTAIADPWTDDLDLKGALLHGQIAKLGWHSAGSELPVNGRRIVIIAQAIEVA